ncbi:MAG: hypothetical protein AB4426_08365 [Xenococcaceae cyanobacterium]
MSEPTTFLNRAVLGVGRSLKSQTAHTYLMTDLLVDTDILIDITNNDETAKKRLADESQTLNLCISAITVMELERVCKVQNLM